MLVYYHANKFIKNDKFDVLGWVNYILELNDKNHINTLTDPEEQLKFGLALQLAQDISDETKKDLLKAIDEQVKKENGDVTRSSDV